MSAVRKIYRVSPLAEKMSEPGGITVEEALTQAEAGLASHYDEAMQTIRQRLARLEFLAAEQRAETTAEVYAVAEALLDLAGFFDTGPLHPAVSSLCDIADHMLHDGRWNWEAVMLHVTAMRLILDSGCRDDAASVTLLQGLARLTGHLRQERVTGG
jgi:hypothetical protein